MVRATPTTVQVEESTTWYHLNHCTRVPKVRKEQEKNRQADNSGEGDEERPLTQDKGKLIGSLKTDVQGAHILLITCLMNQICQTQAMTNSTQTSPELTFQSSDESSSFDLRQKEQGPDEKEKNSRQNRHIVDDNYQIKSNHFYCHITTAQVPW